MWRLALLLMALVVGFAPVSAAAEQRVYAHPVYYQDLGYAIEGYDAVSFFLNNEPLQGAMTYSVVWKGATWLFSSAEHQAMFEANPRAYAPKFGGYCAYGVSRGNLVSGNPTSFEIRDGALYMLHSPAIQTRWNTSAEALLLDAQQNWPDILRK